jgi:predicted transcriptional regulator
MKSRVLLCLSLEGQPISDLEDRLLKSGGPTNRDTLRTVLSGLVTRGLVHMEQEGRALYFRLAVGPAVEVALDDAWAEVQAHA